MMIKKKCCYFDILTFSMILCFAGKIHAQQSNTMYFLKGIPQSQMFNPATQPKCNIFVGLPGVSNVGIDVANNALNVSDVIHYNYDIDSTVFALNPYDGDDDAFLKNFGRKNYFSVLTNLNILSFGFRSDDYYFTFAYRIKGYGRILYPTDYFRLIVEGNEHGNEFDFSDFRIDVTTYQEFSFGLSKMIDPYLSVGANAKVLFGIANVSQRNTEVSATTTRFSIPFHVQFTQNINVPFMDILYTDERIEDIDFQEEITSKEYIKNAFGNFGLGLDLGGHYSIDEKITLSASVIDLGFIRWKTNPINMKQDASYLLRGAYIESSDTTDWDQVMEDMIDSLDNNLLIHENSASKYTTALPAKIYLGATYLISKDLQLGLLSRSEFFKKRLYQQLTLSTTFFPDKVISPTFSYTLMNKSYNNLGFGTSIKLGWLHFYFLSDNIPVVFAKEVNDGYPIPHKMKSVNFHCGFNLLFGCNKMKKLLKDRPIVE